MSRMSEVGGQVDKMDRNDLINAIFASLCSSAQAEVCWTQGTPSVWPSNCCKLTKHSKIGMFKLYLLHIDPRGP